MKKLLLSLLLTVACASVGARQSMDVSLETKLGRTDLVVIAQATGRELPELENGSVFRVEVVNILATVKGNVAERELAFVTVGFSDEMNPECCEPGKVYLLFLSRGFLSFDTSGEMDQIVALEKERYVSPASGSFSAYEVRNGRVLRWNGRKSVAVDEVLQELADVSSKSEQ